ncbi:hypothetical protein BU26DRAFT_63510 [Trematosphaeria pertusa]|uniref:Telomeric single stranded DNA binding POT1/Cdc13 domain-containing protein n=1 Tax=Trematosphaeria pertusa TaxID=390896 RepID=A0A6A6I737_9PLEO|nr:uncharacterized protein BU26DRAFT_63510 [Trematosphaeria pertusa]KAF2246156.1 hypothetical protein BU26DRAFT_63510 [Trematosphaeria pertusa]
MERVAIAELTPTLPALECKQFKAVVTLIWPYSSSARQFALLLGDPDFRLRRKKGQVRARFCGSSAKALASTGVGIGDELLLGLRGAQFVQDGSVSTPGKSIDWELSYSQTLAVRVYRTGAEIGSLDLADAAPTPARSPVRQQPHVASDGAHKWSSPAFLKRTRLSDGPIFEAGYDPFSDDTEDRHDRKRRRKSYRDWNAWTYSARTPSPEKEEADMEDLGAFEASPIRPVRLPETPVSSPAPGIFSVAGLPLQKTEDTASGHVARKEAVLSIGHVIVENEDLVGKSAEANDDFVRDAAYYDLYAGPNELPPSELEYPFAGDTEPNTEEEGSPPAVHGVESLSVTNGETAESDEQLLDRRTPTFAEFIPDGEDLAEAEDRAASSTEQESTLEGVQGILVDQEARQLEDEEQRFPERSGTQETPIVLDDAPEIIMPPPTLPLLQTDLQATSAPGMLTPIGKEPSSPALKPLDSSTLPMPSPFPGERDGTATSYLDLSDSTQPLAQEGPEDESDYIIESSFYSSVSSSKAPAFHPTHESAFTDVRFTFGMDGSTFSRPKAPPKSPEPQVAAVKGDGLEMGEEPAVVDGGVPTSATDRSAPQQEVTQVPAWEGITDFTADDLGLVEQEKRRIATTEPSPAEQPKEPEVVVLSSGSESEESEDESEFGPGNEEAEEEGVRGTPTAVEYSVDTRAEESSVLSEFAEKEEIGVDYHDHTAGSNPGEPTQISVNAGPHMVDHAEAPLLGIQRLTAATEVVDLGSGSEDASSEVDGDSYAVPRAATQVGMIQQEEGTTDVNSYPAIMIKRPQSPVEDSNTCHKEGISELMVVEPAHDESQAKDIAQGDSTYSIDEQVDYAVANLREDGGPVMVDDGTPLAIDDMVEFMPDATSRQDQQPSVEPVSPSEDHPEIKMESIEEDVSFGWMNDRGSCPQEDDKESTEGPSAELLITFPEDGHPIGELQFKSVSATGPARNTRSKTKMSESPVKEEASPSQRSTRSRKSKTSVVPLARTTLSPFDVRSRSTASPIGDTMATSPYSLRPQPEPLSPTKSTTHVAQHERSYKRSTKQKSTALTSPLKESFTQPEYFDYENLDFPTTSFEPSQELGISRGKFSNVSFVRDSEEGSLHSEHSLSTLQYSDDWNVGPQTYTNISDPAENTSQVRSEQSSRLKPRPSDHLPQLETPPRPGAKTQWRNQSQVIIPARRTPPQPAYSFLTQPPQSSPSKAFPSMTPTEVTSGSSRKSQRFRKDVYDIPSSPARASDDELPGETTPKAHTGIGEVAYSTLPLEGEGSQIRSSPPAPITVGKDAPTGVREQLPSSPPAVRSKFPPVSQQSLANSNMPITPEATQPTLVESQPAGPAAQQEQSLPLTPQLTQTTSAGLRFFNADVEIEEVTAEPFVKPSPISKTTPRRNATEADVASREASPSIHSEDLSESEDEASKMEPPSIGLSTPIAYYTPLKDLCFFLNRSSQFHSSANPDVIALMTSSTTAPKKADKGPRHWNTTLHITDLSSHPASVTVQIFRPYANALPVAEKGDIILLRGFQVKSLNRHPMLLSGEESAWCVWRYTKPCWGKKRGAYGEVRAREEVKGPVVERGEGEWREVERLRAWWTRTVKRELEEKEANEIKTRSKDKAELEEMDAHEIRTRSKDKGKGKAANGFRGD